MAQRTTGTIYDPIRKIWSGPKRKDMYGPDMTLGEVMLHSLSRTPNKVIQVMDTTGEELTAEQLLQESKLMAVAIQQFGYQIGDVIGINATNTTNLTAVILGALLCGTPLHAVYPGFDKDSIKYIYEVSQPKLIFCDVETYDVSKAVIDELKLNADIITVNGKINGVKSVKEILASIIIDCDNLTFPCAKMTGDDTAFILCSSGTTGTPKGIHSSHKMTLNRPIFFILPENAVLFTWSTMYWASGYWILFSSLINCVKRVITNKPYSPEYFIELIEKHHISHLMGSSRHWIPLTKLHNVNLKKALSSISAALCGGSKVPKVISESVNSTLENSLDGLIVCYGMSEVMAITRNEAFNRREGTEGKLEPNTEIRIVGKDGQLLGPNEEGILHIRIPYKWYGYYRSPEATQKTYIDEWIVSGDIGYFDDDGYLHLNARENDVFKSNGFQICPQFIEEIIVELPGVQDVCVFGIPDFTATNLTACAIVRENSKEGVSLKADDITNHVKDKMASVYHIQGGVYFVSDLPKTGSGKIIRRKVLEIINSK